jgi:hypothetical protein
MSEFAPESQVAAPTANQPNEQAQSSEPCAIGETIGTSSAPVGFRFHPVLGRLEMAAGMIEWGLPILGLLTGARILLQLGNEQGVGAAGWVDAVLNSLYVVGGHALAGLGIGALLRVLGSWVSFRAGDDQEQRRGLAALGDRIEAGSARLVPAWNAGSEVATPVTALDRLKDHSLAEIRRSIRAGDWKEAGALFDAFSQDYLNDPRVFSMHKELQSAREAALKEHTAQFDAARKVNDPDRVLELHQVLIPLLEAEARSSLEADLSKWFLKLIHNRLRTGKIQTDVVVLAGRIAEVFSHTAEGASLRASLPTLRRSAGLCPRCAQPYTGIADACPSCLSLPP